MGASNQAPASRGQSTLGYSAKMFFIRSRYLDRLYSILAAHRNWICVCESLLPERSDFGVCMIIVFTVYLLVNAMNLIGL